MYYEVQNISGQKLFGTYEKEAAIRYYHRNPAANQIQFYTKKGGIRTGSLQPCVPQYIYFQKQQYEKAYHGFFTEKLADQIVQSFNEEGSIPAIKKKFKHGFQVYVKVV